MKKTLKSVYNNLFINESLNVMPKSLNPNERPISNVYSRKNQTGKIYPKHLLSTDAPLIPTGKGLKDSLYRIDMCIEYLQDDTDDNIIEFGFTNKSGIPPVKIKLQENETKELLNIFKLMLKRYKSSGTSDANKARAARNLDRSRKIFEKQYMKILKEIYSRSETFVFTNLSYVTFKGKGFENHVKASIRHEVNTVNNASGIFRNIQNLYRSMIISLDRTIKEVYEGSIEIFYKNVKSIVDSSTNHHECVETIYKMLDTKVNSLLAVNQKFNIYFKEYISSSNFNIDTTNSFSPVLDMQNNKALKTAISFLIIDLQKEESYLGIVKNLEGTPYPENITAKDVSDSSSQRSDLEFKLPHFTIQKDHDSIDDDSRKIQIKEKDRSLEIELKDGLPRGGSGTFWIAFEEKEHQKYINKKIESSVNVPRSRYIFKGTQNKDLWPIPSEGSEKYKPIQEKVNSIFKNFESNNCLPLDLVTKDTSVFYMPFTESYFFEGKNYFLYYMRTQKTSELDLYNYKHILQGKPCGWLSTYYHKCKNNEFIDINKRGLYLLDDPSTFKMPENRKFGLLCKEGKIKDDNGNPIHVPVLTDKDLDHLQISLSGKRGGCKWEAYVSQNIGKSSCKGFETSNQKFIYKFLLLSSLVFSSQSHIVLQDDSFYDFIIENSLDILGDISNLRQESFLLSGNKLLKEVYFHLFNINLIKEGGLAGHMMHPYEALDMTIGQIIDRIKEYGAPQSIIEKVDGQNLFFTVEQDGTLMFARNKEDMTHGDLVEKFTNHPAEVPFVTGGNAIKRGIDQWLSSAGSFRQQEILDIFHPDGEARSFINFEIMHKDHPNQIEYGENYIVFHSIVDFVNGREAVYSSNNSRRLDKLISLMKPGIESSGYTLASNRTVELNKLTNVQISEYVSQIKEIADSLDITKDEFLGDGVQKQIQKKINELGVSISEDALNILYDFALYGEDKHGSNIKSKDFTKLMDKEDVVKLRSIGLTSASKALSVVLKILSPFKDVFVDLGIDLLDGVPSSYMSQEVDLSNVDMLRDKLQTAMDDLENYMSYTPESSWDALVVRLKPHYDKVNNIGVYNAISTSVEGGVYDHEGDLLKVTGGFAPMNQILGAAYRDKKGIFPSFKEKFMQQESNRRSLKTIFNSIF